MRSKSIFIFLAMVLLTSCASPAPQPMVTAVPSSTHTPFPTPTQTVIPTSTHTPEPALPTYDIEVPSMDEFDFAWAWEKGKVVAVDDLYGAGPATLRVEEIKIPEAEQVLKYREVMQVPQSSADAAGHHYEAMLIQYMTLEGMSLVNVDIADNTMVPDGDYVVLRLGGLLKGQQFSFEIWTGKDWDHNWSAREIFDHLQVGENLDYISWLYVRKGIDVPFAEMDKIFGEQDWSEEERRENRFLGLGRQQFKPMTSKEIWRQIFEGGVLEKNEVLLGSIRQEE